MHKFKVTHMVNSYAFTKKSVYSSSEPTKEYVQNHLAIYIVA